MDQEVKIQEVIQFNPALTASVRHLVSQLNDNFEPLTDDDLKEIIQSDCTHLYLASLSTGEIAGMITLVTCRIPYKRTGSLEDFVVDTKYRKRGIGKKLLFFAVDQAKKLGIKSLHFTSRPERVAANHLYTSLGFVKRDTNVYKVDL